MIGSSRRFLVIGLDSVPADLFLKLSKDLPNIRRMLERGLFAVLESCHPPITVPAWMVMMTSKSPGELGIYGFRHRKGTAYGEGWVVNSNSIREQRLWELLGKRGKKSCLVGVPPSYPPIPVDGNLVSCFLTPKESNEFTHPPSLAAEIRSLLKDRPYLFDVKFRTENRDQILEQLYQMMDRRFEVIKYLIQTKEWDYMMFVEIGVDRLHHMFWKYYDKEHPKYVPHSKYENAIPDYYQHLDEKIGELTSMVDDNTFVLIVSDHGTAAMRGAFCINEWLIREGYLVLKDYPKNVVDLEKSDVVDWNKTAAWGWGGYYGRIFFNVKGREPKGIVNMKDYDKVRNELREKILSIRGPNGEKFDNRVLFPENIYGECNGQKPDVMVYFDNLFWRSAGTVGHNALYLSENDTGPDDSVHSMDGIFLLWDKGREKPIQSRLTSISASKPEHLEYAKSDNHPRFSIYDVSPIILHCMEISEIPSDMRGHVPAELQDWVRDPK